MIIFLKLLIAHIITDFFLQPDEWVKDKQEKTYKSKYLYYHVLITGLGALLFLGDIQYIEVVLFITATHFIIDLYKLTFLRDDLGSFLFDQLLHLAILVIATFLIVDTEIDMKVLNEHITQKNLAILAAYLFITIPSGYIVGIATQRWRQELISDEKERDSLTNAGIWIGILERIFVLTFFLLNTLEAVGFLIAAKSILRFSSKDENNPRKQTEYVLIGTLISFLIALLVGIILQQIKV